MAYRVKNKLPKTIEGRDLELVSDFETFEQVAGKVIQDLNSVWKGIVPFPIEFKIEEVNAVDGGMRLYEDGVEVASNPGQVEGVMERYGLEVFKERLKIEEIAKDPATAKTLKRLIDEGLATFEHGKVSLTEKGKKDPLCAEALKQIQKDGGTSIISNRLKEELQ